MYKLYQILYSNESYIKATTQHESNWPYYYYCFNGLLSLIIYD